MIRLGYEVTIVAIIAKTITSSANANDKLKGALRKKTFFMILNYHRLIQLSPSPSLFVCPPLPLSQCLSSMVLGTSCSNLL